MFGPTIISLLVGMEESIRLGYDFNVVTFFMACYNFDYLVLIFSFSANVPSM